MMQEKQKKSGLANAVNSYVGKQDWSTSWPLFYTMCDRLNVDPVVDMMATKYNTKCRRFITPECDFFQTEVYYDSYINPEYKAGNLERGERGIGHAIARAYNQHIYHNINMLYLLPSTATSTPWFATYFGDRLYNEFGEKSDILLIRKRQKFTDGPTNGGPPFSSQAFLHRRKTEFELITIRKRYEENDTKLMWYIP